MTVRDERTQPRAALYCRVSTIQQGDEGTSLGTQLAACRAYANEHDLSVPTEWELLETHSGAELFERPMLGRIREAMARKEIQAVVCYSVDRLSRSQIHLGLLLSEGDRYGVTIHFVTEPLEKTAVGIFLQSARAFAAELERERIRERSMRGKRAKIAGGKVFGYGPNLYGYERDNEKGIRVIVEDEAQVVRDIYRWIAHEAIGMRAICRRLNDAGVPSPGTGKRAFRDPDKRRLWHPSQLANIVRNPAYKGEGFALRYAANHTKKGVPDMRPRDEWLPLAPDTTPAIIDAETWTLAQKRLDTNRGEHARNIRHPMLLRGFVFCGVCGKKMAVQPPHERSPRYRLRCTSRSNDLGETWCGGASMVAEDVERDVWEKVSRLVLDPRLIARGVEKRGRGTDNKDSERRRTAIRAEMARIETQQKRFLDHFGEDDPDFPWEMMRERVADLQRRRARLVDDLAALDAVTPETVPDTDALLTLPEWCARAAANLPRLTLEQKRAILDVFGIRVEGNGGRWRVWSERLGREL
jgi:site-specific DNA recombinase